MAHSRSASLSARGTKPSTKLRDALENCIVEFITEAQRRSKRTSSGAWKPQGAMQFCEVHGVEVGFVSSQSELSTPPQRNRQPPLPCPHSAHRFHSILGYTALKFAILSRG